MAKFDEYYLVYELRFNLSFSLKMNQKECQRIYSKMEVETSQNEVENKSYKC